MTVRELIAKLQTMDGTMLVVLCDSSMGNFSHDVNVRHVVYSDDKGGVQFMDHPEAGPMGPLGPVQGESVGWDDEDEDDRPHDLVSAVMRRWRATERRWRATERRECDPVVIARLDDERDAACAALEKLRSKR